MRARYVGTACIAAALFGFGAWQRDRLPGWLKPVQATSVPEPQPPPEPPPGPVRIVAVGDLMLGTNVKAVIRKHGARHPFRKYRKLLEGADIAFGNLETPLSDRGAPTPGKSKESLRNHTNFIFRAPPACAAGLAWAGFDIVSLANNHAMDFGPEALRDTLESLEEAGIAVIGGGANLDRAYAPHFLERNGQRIALLGISDILPAFSEAGKERPGIAPARGKEFEARMPDAIAAARKEADQVIVSVHWGKERFTGATPKQRKLGRRLIDWGADLVIGHHTHCMGPVERYGGGLIHYSLGNFVSYTGSRANVEAWEVVLRPGEEPEQASHVYRWDGKYLNARREDTPGLKTASARR